MIDLIRSFGYPFREENLDMKTGVLVHGCHLGALNWRGIMWGDPPDELGRIPKAVSVALQEGGMTRI